MTTPQNPTRFSPLPAAVAKPLRRLLGLCALIAVSVSITSAPVYANPSQEDVFKSIQSNMDGSVDGGKVLAFLAVGAGIVIVLVLFNRRQKREAAPRALNHQGKLLRELMKTAGLKPAEARQLKLLADGLAEKGEPLESAITLLLCPSLMQRARGK